MPSISVVVLSHNYARYLEARLSTIFAQDCPILEIIVIDDASSDGSAAMAESTAQSFDREIRVLRQSEPSGSVFTQWRKAAEIASGDWLWIAEADDLCEPRFLSTLAQVATQSPHVAMAFCDSRAIDQDGVELWASYKEYYSNHGGHDLSRDLLMDGESFVMNYLSATNIIMNASAVLFRRRGLLGALQRSAPDLSRLHVAGDWRVYLEILLQPRAHIAYVAEPLNIHRRHGRSVTASLDPARQLREIELVQDVLAGRLKRDPDLAARQREYRATLQTQFGLKTYPKKKRIRLP